MIPIFNNEQLLTKTYAADSWKCIYYSIKGSNTALILIINFVSDALYLHFGSSQSTDLKDDNIKRAIQDWLRLAGQRHKNSQKKGLPQ